MYQLLRSELLKLKRSRYLWLLALGPALPVIISMTIFFDSAELIASTPVESLVRQNQIVMNVVVGQVVMALLTGFVVTREHRDQTINMLYTYPFRRSDVYVGKLLLILLFCISFFLLSFLSVLVNVLIYYGDMVTLAFVRKHFIIYLLMALMHYSLVPLVYTICLFGKRMGTSLLIGGALLIVTGLFITEQQQAIYPWTVPLATTIFLVGNDPHLPVHIESAWPGVVSLATVFTIPLLFNFVFLEKMDVHSGS